MSSEILGNQLQWLAGADEPFLKAIDKYVRAHAAKVLRSRRQDDPPAPELTAALGDVLRWLAVVHDVAFLNDLRDVVTEHIAHRKRNRRREDPK